MTSLILILSFVFGAIIGSFLNVVIYRMNTGRSWGGRSHCMRCNKQLAWYELIPIVSWLALRGRCRSCTASISPQYIIVETIMGVVTLLTVLTFLPLATMSIGSFLSLSLIYLLFFSVLAVIAFYDIRHKVIPHVPLILLVVVAVWIKCLGPSIFPLQLPAFASFVPILFAVPFWLLSRFSRETLFGMGDVKLIAILAFFLGLWNGFLMIVLAFVIGAVYGIGLVLLKKADKKTQVPFAPFLILSTILIFFGFISFPMIFSLFSVY